MTELERKLGFWPEPLRTSLLALWVVVWVRGLHQDAPSAATILAERVDARC